MKRRHIWLLMSLCTIGLLGLFRGSTQAYDTYSTDRSSTNCAACHGGFRATPYVSRVDGQSWVDGLHDVHRYTMLNSDCDTCHSSGPRFPVRVSSSVGGVGLSAIACVGCHGRAQDATSGTVGSGAGLRQHHWRAGTMICLNCHTDANPANKTVVGESVKPPYYANPGSGHPRMPTDPCNPAPAFNESFEGTTRGLDNDGDGTYDASDPDCAPATPGEASRPAASPMRAVWNRVMGRVDVTYSPACGSSDHTIYFGDLASVGTYGYTGAVCPVGTTGTASFSPAANNVFFLIVGNDGSVEGSYGRNNSGIERPEAGAISGCNWPRNLTNSCDP